MSEPQPTANSPSSNTDSADDGAGSSKIPDPEPILADLYRSEWESRRAAEAGQQQFAFLTALSRYAAASLDEQTLLQTIAEITVPYLADRCHLYLRQGDGPLMRAASACAEPRDEDRIRQIERQYPSVANPRHPVQAAVASGEMRLIRDVRAQDLGAIAKDECHLTLLRDLGPRSMIVVPLIAHRQTVGGAVLVIAGSERRYSEADLAMAEEFGRRVALAVENAQLHQKVREAVHLREEFLAAAAHELQTPVTSLRGFAQLTLRQFEHGRPTDTHRLQRGLEIIDRQAKRLSILVNQLLDISRAEAGQLALSPEPTDIVALVNGVVESMRIGVIRHTLKIRATAPIIAVVDPLRLELVMTSLIENAIKYSPEGGPIEIEITQPEPKTVRLAVRDRGIGISPQHLPLIFDRFYRAHADRNYGGLGLGLYIAQHIVSLHGGRLEAETPPDGGTRFVITLPSEDARAESGHRLGIGAAPPRLG